MLVWLENAYPCPFLGSFWGTFPPNDVTHCPNHKKDHPLAEPRHLSHKPRKSVARFELGVWTRKKGQDRTGQEKVTKGLYFTYVWRSPHWSDVHKNLCSGWCSRRNHVCQVSKWNFQMLQFYRGSNFPFFIDFEWALQQCSATALPVIVMSTFVITRPSSRLPANKDSAFTNLQHHQFARWQVVLDCSTYPSELSVAIN